MNPVQFTYIIEKNYDTLNNQFKSSIKYFMRSYYKIAILLEIMKSYYQVTDDVSSVEALCKKVHNISSRTTVVNFINELRELKLVKTQSSRKDKRLKIITPSNILVEDYEKWAKLF